MTTANFYRSEQKLIKLIRQMTTANFYRSEQKLIKLIRQMTTANDYALLSPINFLQAKN
jgi:hypothetical protein